MVDRRQKRDAQRMEQAHKAGKVDLNQVVAYNFRRARELRGWTQEQTADQLAKHLGQRLPQAGVSAIERGWDSDRRREFDAQELLAFAMTFDLPIMWFLLPPPGDHRPMAGSERPLDELYGWLLGQEAQLAPVYERLRELGIEDPSDADRAVEAITGASGLKRKGSLRQRRLELLAAILADEGDRLDAAADELGAFFDHLREVGVRGFVAEHVYPDELPAARAARRTSRQQPQRDK